MRSDENVSGTCVIESEFLKGYSYLYGYSRVHGIKVSKQTTLPLSQSRARDITPDPIPEELFSSVNVWSFIQISLEEECSLSPPP
jgi:hypothetical protein